MSELNLKSESELNLKSESELNFKLILFFKKKIL